MEVKKKIVAILTFLGIVGFATIAFSQSSGFSMSSVNFFKRSGNTVSPLSTNYVLGIDMGAPKNTTSSLQSGGTLATGTPYYYKITAIDGDGGETLPSSQISATPTSTTRTVRLSWDAVTGATSYKIYRSLVSNIFGTSSLASSTTSATFDDATTTLFSGTPPTAGTALSSRIGSSSPSYFVGGNVGIGTTTPAVSLVVAKKNATTSVSIGPGSGSSIGKLCIWNGEEYTVLTFAVGSTTPAYATSTACDEN